MSNLWLELFALHFVERPKCVDSRLLLNLHFRLIDGEISFHIKAHALVGTPTKIVLVVEFSQLRETYSANIFWSHYLTTGHRFYIFSDYRLSHMHSLEIQFPLLLLKSAWRFPWKSQEEVNTLLKYLNALIIKGEITLYWYLWYQNAADTDLKIFTIKRNRLFRVLFDLGWVHAHISLTSLTVHLVLIEPFCITKWMVMVSICTG